MKDEDKCKCSLRIKLVGSGCRYCNPQEYIDHLHDALNEREWQGLTDEQKLALCKQFPDHLTFNAIKAIEAKLKEKNT
jgi:hypothetical protein